MTQKHQCLIECIERDNPERHNILSFLIYFWSIVASFSVLFGLPTIVYSGSCGVDTVKELSNVDWNMTVEEIRSHTGFSLNDKVNNSEYTERGKFNGKPCQYNFSMFNNGLRSVVLHMEYTEKNKGSVKDYFFNLCGKPSLIDSKKEAYQWKDKSDETTIFFMPNNILLIGFRNIETTRDNAQIGPSQLSCLQGVYLDMPISELKKLPIVRPLNRISDQIYKSHTIFNGRSSTITFSFEYGKLEKVGLHFIINNASANSIRDIFLEYREFLLSKYGNPTQEDKKTPAVMWKEKNQIILFRWLQNDKSFVLFFAKN